MSSVEPQEGLALSHLRVAYGRKVVFADLTAPMVIRHGEVAALLGPNGSGKSTLMKGLAGLVPMTGEVRLDGQQLVGASFAERARRVVYLPQALPQSVHLRVFETVLAAGRAGVGGGLLARATTDEFDAVSALLDRLGIAHLAMQFLDQLSGGQKQMVGLAQALVREPVLLLLDEPLSALDLNYQVHVMSLIREETRRRGMVTLVVLHDINIALRDTDAALLVCNGNLYSQGRPEEVITSAALAEVYGVAAQVERTSLGVSQVVIAGLAEGVRAQEA